jgi:hypothetical protein
MGGEAVRLDDAGPEGKREQEEHAGDHSLQPAQCDFF